MFLVFLFDYIKFLLYYNNAIHTLEKLFLNVVIIKIIIYLKGLAHVIVAKMFFNLIY